MHLPKKSVRMKIKTILFATFLLLIISCKKNGTTNNPPPDKYLTFSAGSTWNYHQTDSSGTTPANEDYTLTSTSRDSSINSRTYHIFSNSMGGNQYFSSTSSDYYQFDSLPAGFGTTTFERFYLVDIAPVGFSWTQTLTVTLSGIPVQVLLTYNIAEKGISRTVNGKIYTDVIHVTTSISSGLFSLTSNINNYYAEKYGLIESKNIIQVNYMGFIQNINTETKLVSANIVVIKLRIVSGMNLGGMSR